MTIVNHLLNGTDIQGTSLYLASLLQKEAPNFDRTRASKYFAFPSLTPPSFPLPNRLISRLVSQWPPVAIRVRFENTLRN